MPLTELLQQTHRQMLRALGAWLRKGEKGCADPRSLMSAQLAPDMFPLASQVRFACVQAREPYHRLRGEALPTVVADLLEEGRNGLGDPGDLRQALECIDRTLAFLGDIASDVPAIRADGLLTLELPDGLVFDLTGEAYICDWALPQFYFHLMSAYALLRNAGLEIGKADYVAHMFAHIRRPTAGGA